MNSVNLIGRLTKDAEVRYTTGDKPMAIARFTLAVDRLTKKDEADFIGCVAFGKTAEVIEKYTGKGKMIGLTGRIQTGSYEKEGKKIYTTDVIADRIELLGGGKQEQAAAKEEPKEDIPSGFTQLDCDIPF